MPTLFVRGTNQISLFDSLKSARGVIMTEEELTDWFGAINVKYLKQEIQEKGTAIVQLYVVRLIKLLEQLSKQERDYIGVTDCVLDSLKRGEAFRFGAKYMDYLAYQVNLPPKNLYVVSEECVKINSLPEETTPAKPIYGFGPEDFGGSDDESHYMSTRQGLGLL